MAAKNIKDIDAELDEILKTLPPGRILKIDEIANRTSLSRASIHRIERDALRKIRSSKLRQYWEELE